MALFREVGLEMKLEKKLYVHVIWKPPGSWSNRSHGGILTLHRSHQQSEIFSLSESWMSFVSSHGSLYMCVWNNIKLSDHFCSSFIQPPLLLCIHPTLPRASQMYICINKQYILQKGLESLAKSDSWKPLRYWCFNWHLAWNKIITGFYNVNLRHYIRFWKSQCIWYKPI